MQQGWRKLLREATEKKLQECPFIRIKIYKCPVSNWMLKVLLPSHLSILSREKRHESVEKIVAEWHEIALRMKIMNSQVTNTSKNSVGQLTVWTKNLKENYQHHKLCLSNIQNIYIKIFNSHSVSYIIQSAILSSFPS